MMKLNPCVDPSDVLWRIQTIVTDGAVGNERKMPDANIGSPVSFSDKRHWRGSGCLQNERRKGGRGQPVLSVVGERPHLVFCVTWGLGTGAWR